jgi:hypothetical protein
MDWRTADTTVKPTGALGTPPQLAVMLLEPTARPIARPGDVMLATPADDEPHEAEVVTSRLLPFEKCAVAVNCWVRPIGRLAGVAGATTTLTSVTGWTSTSRVAVPLTVPLVAITSAVPAAVPGDTRPGVELRVAPVWPAGTDHVTWFVMS